MPRSTKRRMRRTRRTRRVHKRFYRGGNTDQCLFTKLAGGLGNQLYMYAAAHIVSKKLQTPICLLPVDNKHSSRSYTDILSAKSVEDTPEIQSRVDAARVAVATPETYFSKVSDVDAAATNSRDKKMPEGYFQNYPSIQAVIPEIKEMFMKNEFYKDQYKPYKAMIQDEKSVAFLHVRRGDYADLGWLDEDDYYQKALEVMNKSDKIKHIYILSNDIEWCKTQEATWKKISKKTLECKDIPNELEALYFMTLCKGGAILSSSTFSSWGVYMGANEYPDSYIIYPKHNSITKQDKNEYEFPDRWIAV